MLSALSRRGKKPFFGLPVFFLLLSFLIGTNQGFSQQATTTDQAQVIQACIDLPGMQQFYPRNSEGIEEPLYIYYYHPLLFSNDLELTRSGKPVSLKVMATSVESMTNPFFLFSSFIITGNTASTQYDFYYTQGGLQHKVQVKVDLEKSENKWTIIKTDIKN